MNSGIQDSIGPVAGMPSRPLNQPCWKTSTIAPYAAPMDSRFSRIALIGTTIERNVNSSSRNAARITKPNTSGRCEIIESLKSRSAAVSPVE